jgi:hypothetical protein
VPPAQQFGAQGEGDDLNETRRRRENLTIMDRLNELYGICKGMSNATFSQIASWAYGPIDSVASDVDPEWPGRCKDLDPPSSFGKVRISRLCISGVILTPACIWMSHMESSIFT